VGSYYRGPRGAAAVAGSTIRAVEAVGRGSSWSVEGRSASWNDCRLGTGTASQKLSSSYRNPMVKDEPELHSRSCRSDWQLISKASNVDEPRPSERGSDQG
jgi:hypothetical protein